ncbi:Protein of unknown function [Pyronema omphalodes CBS 100304]|uniref:Uncharacterized protein n=1 Tax=Pyronema omphalodes (strain CBS 100304) TaxID=1076935 RepID=U4LDN5_PYROM|nr:Protein of unknown function [Pyronema omphalodes CBS 100304]
MYLQITPATGLQRRKRSISTQPKNPNPSKEPAPLKPYHPLISFAPPNLLLLYLEVHPL